MELKGDARWVLLSPLDGGGGGVPFKSPNAFGLAWSLEGVEVPEFDSGEASPPLVFGARRSSLAWRLVSLLRSKERTMMPCVSAATACSSVVSMRVDKFVVKRSSPSLHSNTKVGCEVTLATGTAFAVQFVQLVKTHSRYVKADFQCVREAHLTIRRTIPEAISFVAKGSSPTIFAICLCPRD